MSTRRSPHGKHSNGKGAATAKILTCYTNPRPSKWDDAQKWLSGPPGGRRGSNADDRRLLPSLLQPGRRSCGSAGGATESSSAQDEGETKRVDSVETYRCICLRDMGTEMTPVGSAEPSRASTPRVSPAAAAAAMSPLSAWLRPASPVHGGGGWRGEVGDAEMCEGKGARRVADMRVAVASPATAWDDAERAKYMARYKREEVKIQAWEDHEKRKAEMEMKMTEVKAERMKSRAQEEMAKKMASARVTAKEKRARAAAKLSERSARISQKAECLRRRGRLRSSCFSLRLPLLCS